MQVSYEHQFIEEMVRLVKAAEELARDSSQGFELDRIASAVERVADALEAKPERHEKLYKQAVATYDQQASDDFADLEKLSRRLQLPKAYIQRERKAGRIPCLQAGGQVRFSISAVQAALAERAADASASANRAIERTSTL